MTDSKAVIADILKQDDTVRDLIGNRQSIVPAGRLTAKHKYPAITLQEGTTVRREERTLVSSIYIRVYDDVERATIKINKIGARIYELLDHQTLELERGVFIRCHFDSSLAELEDPALHKNFIEYHYTIDSL